MTRRDSESSPRRPSMSIGAASGVLATLGFMIIHDVWILDIWDMTKAMVFSGAISGLAIVWSYNAAVTRHSTSRWLGYNGLIALLLVLLGIASSLLLTPRFTMAEAMRMDDAMAELMPPAIPAMAVAVLVGTFVLWSAFGRRPRAWIPVLVAQIPIVFFLGHQYAMLGVVEMGDEFLVTYGGFVALTLYLAGSYAALTLALLQGRQAVRSAPTSATRP